MHKPAVTITGRAVAQYFRMLQGYLDLQAHCHMVVCLQIDDWPALHKWNSKYLKKAFKGKHVLAGDYPMGFDNFLAYSQRSHDEMPLYLFDKHFAKAPQLAADYKVLNPAQDPYLSMPVAQKPFGSLYASFLLSAVLLATMPSSRHPACLYAADLASVCSQVLCSNACHTRP